MKKTLLLSCLNWLAWASPALAAPHATTPVDTVAGHAQMRRILSVGLCTKFEAENKRRSFSDLTTHQLDKLTEGLVMSIIGENLDAFQALQKQVPKRKQHAYEEQLGKEAMLEMVDNCPTMKTILPQIARQSIKDKSPISAAERAVLLPIAQAACQRLEDENKRQPLSQHTTAEQQALIVRAVQAPILTNAPALMEYYGEDILSSEARATVMGERMALIMLDICPRYMLLLGLGMSK